MMNFYQLLNFYCLLLFQIYILTCPAFWLLVEQTSNSMTSPWTWTHYTITIRHLMFEFLLEQQNLVRVWLLGFDLITWVCRVGKVMCISVQLELPAWTSSLISLYLIKKKKINKSKNFFSSNTFWLLRLLKQGFFPCHNKSTVSHHFNPETWKKLSTIDINSSSHDSVDHKHTAC